MLETFLALAHRDPFYMILSGLSTYSLSAAWHFVDCLGVQLTINVRGYVMHVLTFGVFIRHPNLSSLRYYQHQGTPFASVTFVLESTSPSLTYPFTHAEWLPASSLLSLPRTGHLVITPVCQAFHHTLRQSHSFSCSHVVHGNLTCYTPPTSSVL